MAVQLARQAVSAMWDNSIGPAAAYEVQIQRIQANTGMTDQATQAMSATILQMAQTTSAPIDGLAQGYFRLTNEGFNAAEATKILTATQQLAVGTGADVAKTTNLISIVMHDYGIEAGKAENVTSAFLRAAHLGNTTMEEFAAGLRRPLPVAAALGISFQELAAAEAEMTRQGQTTEVAGTQLYNFMLRMQNPTHAQTQELLALDNALGSHLVPMWSSAGVAQNGFAGVVDYTNKVLGGHDEIIQKIVPNMRGLLAGIALLGKGNSEYNSILDSTTKAYTEGTATQIAFEASQNTLTGQMGKLHNVTQELQIGLGNVLLPVIKDLVTWATNASLQLLNWADSHKPLIQGIENAARVMGHFATNVLGGTVKEQIRLTVLDFANLLEAIARFDLAMANLERHSKLPGAVEAMNEWIDRAHNLHMSAAEMIGDFNGVTRATTELGPPVSMAAGGLDQLSEKTRQAQLAALNLGDTQKEEKHALDLLSQANIKAAEGHVNVAALLQQEAQAYRDGNAVEAERIARLVREAEAQDTLNTKVGKEAVTAAVNYGAEIKTLTTGQEAFARATNALGNSVIASDSARLVSAKAAAAGTLAAWGAALTAESEAIASGNAVAIKLAVDRVTEADAAYKTDVANVKSAQTEIRAEHAATRQALDDMGAAMLANFAAVNTSLKDIPTSIRGAFGEVNSVVQNTYSQIIDLDHQLQGELTADDRTTLQERRTDLEGWLTTYKKIGEEIKGVIKDMHAADKQAAADQKAVETDLAAFRKVVAEARKQEHADQIALLKDEDALTQKLADDNDKAAKSAEKNAESLGKAAQKVQEAIAKAKQDAADAAAETSSIQMQVGFQDRLNAAIAAMSSAQQSGNKAQLDALNDQISAETSLKDSAQQVLDQQAMQVTVLKQQSSELSAQISLSTDLLAAQGKTSGTDKNLLALQVEKDKLTIAGDSTAEVDKQIKLETEKNKLAADTNALSNVGLTLQIAAKKVEEDKLAASNQVTDAAKQQILTANGVLAGLNAQKNAMAAIAQDSQQAAHAATQQNNTANQNAQQQTAHARDKAADDKKLLEDQKAIKTAEEEYGKAAGKAYGDARDAEKKYTDDAKDGGEKIATARRKATDDHLANQEKIKKAYETLREAEQKQTDDTLSNHTQINQANAVLKKDLESLGFNTFPDLGKASNETGNQIHGFATTGSADVNRFATDATTLIQGFGTDSTQAVTSFQQSASGSMVQVQDDTKAAMDNAVASVNRSVAAAGNGGKMFGESIDLGIAAGIDSLASQVAFAGRNLVTELFQAMRTAAGTASPSKIAAEIGGQIGQGLAQGMTDQSSFVSGAATNLIEGMLGPMIAMANNSMNTIHAGNAALRAKGLGILGETPRFGVDFLRSEILGSLNAPGSSQINLVGGPYSGHIWGAPGSQLTSGGSTSGASGSSTGAASGGSAQPVGGNGMLQSISGATDFLGSGSALLANGTAWLTANFPGYAAAVGGSSGSTGGGSSGASAYSSPFADMSQYAQSVKASYASIGQTPSAAAYNPTDWWLSSGGQAVAIAANQAAIEGNKRSAEIWYSTHNPDGTVIGAPVQHLVPGGAFGHWVNETPGANVADFAQPPHPFGTPSSAGQTVNITVQGSVYGPGGVSALSQQIAQELIPLLPQR